MQTISSSQPLPMKTIKSNKALFRSASNRFDPVFFDKTPTRSRFNDPEGRYGVLYVAEALEGAYIETVQNHIPARVIPRTDLEGRVMARLRFPRPLRVVDLTGAGLARLGLDNRVSTMGHAEARLLSRQFFDHEQKPDGVRYRSKHDPEQISLAIFDRPDLLTPALLETWRWTDPERLELLLSWLERYDHGVDEES
jgi:hypothetical protein